MGVVKSFAFLNPNVINLRAVLPPFVKGGGGDLLQLLKNPPQSPFSKGGRKGNSLKLMTLSLTLDKIEHFETGSQIEIFSQVNAPCNFTLDYFFRTSMFNDLPFTNNIGSITYVQRFPYVMIRNNNAETAIFQLFDDLLNIINCQWIDSGKGLVQKHESGVCDQGPGNFQSTSLSS